MKKSEIVFSSVVVIMAATSGYIFGTSAIASEKVNITNVQFTYDQNRLSIRGKANKVSKVKIRVGEKSYKVKVVSGKFTKKSK
ncbi:hypothetical protein EQG49_09610 [Periweissella cryptocerci]|uniref:Uncharacterized protein n=1 Tax=Periweissella cryptocerci TaxID=2506420 RepID=A0A4P6YV68_9LACO|nr:hypothetical protein [Periweissella cryptocerci]QBO36698.1 hypothetical protein EQG49_09610 [Periweissella cryptocerci]